MRFAAHLGEEIRRVTRVEPARPGIVQRRDDLVEARIGRQRHGARRVDVIAAEPRCKGVARGGGCEARERGDHRDPTVAEQGYFKLQDAQLSPSTGMITFEVAAVFCDACTGSSSTHCSMRWNGSFKTRSSNLNRAKHPDALVRSAKVRIDAGLSEGEAGGGAAVHARDGIL
jgi:hypothetical protein